MERYLGIDVHAAGSAISCACDLPGEIRTVHEGLVTHIYRCTGCGIQDELAAPGWRWSDTEDRYVRTRRPRHTG